MKKGDKMKYNIHSGQLSDIEQDETETCKNCRWIKMVNCHYCMFNIHGVDVGYDFYKCECLYDREVLQKNPDDFCSLFQKKDIK